MSENANAIPDKIKWIGWLLIASMILIILCNIIHALVLLIYGTVLLFVYFVGIILYCCMIIPFIYSIWAIIDLIFGIWILNGKRFSHLPIYLPIANIIIGFFYTSYLIGFFIIAINIVVLVMMFQEDTKDYLAQKKVTIKEPVTENVTEKEPR